MTPAGPHPALIDPWTAALEAGEGAVLAVLTATHGPAYRNPGAAMAISANGRYVGAITSGCIEADLVLHAGQVRESGVVRHLRYGKGSPFIDMRLPCGGAIEVMVFSVRDMRVLAALSRERRARRPAALRISASGDLSLSEWTATGPDGMGGFSVGFRPALRFIVFGAGPEASVFASLVRSLGYEQCLVSHEETSLKAARALGCEVVRLQSLKDLDALAIDADCATVLFYHDHDYEPMVLKHLLGTPAFYIGAQGSRATQATRLSRLAAMGIGEDQLARIRGPIGLVPSSRDARTLAVSVLAEVLGEANGLRDLAEVSQAPSVAAL